MARAERHEVEICLTRWPVDPKKLAVFVCALLNSTGGSVVFGKSAEGLVVGAEGSHEDFLELENQVRSLVSPSPFLQMVREHEGGRPVVTFCVPKGCELPYLLEGKAYLFREGKIGYADASELRSMVLRSAAQPIRWEERFSQNENLEYVDETELTKGLVDVSRRQRVSETILGDKIAALRFFEVYKNDRLTNAGDVLFGDRPSLRIPQAKIRAYAYATDKAGESFLDSQMIDAPLCRAINESLLFIARNTAQRDVFTGTMLRRDSASTYPEAVLREALVNAVAHRDYSSVTGGVAIHVYPTRLEIWSSGSLPSGVLAENLGKDQVSVIRNPSIANVLNVRGFMEKAGRGSIKIVQGCLEWGLPRPIWRADDHLGVTVVLQRIIPTGHAGPYVNGLSGPFGRGAQQRLQKAVLEALSDGGCLNRTQLLSLTEASESTLKRALASLVRSGKIVRINGRRFGGYQLVVDNGGITMSNIDFDDRCIIMGCYEAEHSPTGRSAAGYCPEKMRRKMDKMRRDGLIRYEEVKEGGSLNHYAFLGFTDKGRVTFVENGELKAEFRV